MELRIMLIPDGLEFIGKYCAGNLAMRDTESHRVMVGGSILWENWDSPCGKKSMERVGVCAAWLAAEN